MRIFLIVVIWCVLGATVSAHALTGQAAIVYDAQTNETVWEHHPHDQRPIASLTKLMTGLVFSDTNPDWSQQTTIHQTDVYRANRTFLRAGDRLTVRDVFYLMLIASDNAAARTLARISSVGTIEFIQLMNQKTLELGLLQTRFTDTSGLSDTNLSTAYDIAHLITAAGKVPILTDAMQRTSFTASVQRRNVTRKITVSNTNRLLRNSELNIVAGKTGFIRAAGYCVAILLELVPDHFVAVVVLGATTNTARFRDAAYLIEQFTK